MCYQYTHKLRHIWTFCIILPYIITFSFMCLHIFCRYTKTRSLCNKKEGSFALSCFGRVIPTNASKIESCAFWHGHIRRSKCASLGFEIHPISNYTCLWKHRSVLPSMYFVIAASETSLQPQRSLNPCQMLLCYRLLCSLERGCLFSFSDFSLLPNIISFQHRCKGSNDWNYFTSLTLSRDGYQFNYGQLKMIWESPAMGIYHHYELLTAVVWAPSQRPVCVGQAVWAMRSLRLPSPLNLRMDSLILLDYFLFLRSKWENMFQPFLFLSFPLFLSLSVASSPCNSYPSSCFSNYASLEIIHYLKNVNWVDQTCRGSSNTMTAI